MTTITKEQLITQARINIHDLESLKKEAQQEPYASDLAYRSALERDLELARIALASLEAEPIGAFHIAEQQVDGTSDYLKDGEWPIDNGIIEVYAAPPVPVVPEEKPMPNPLSMYAVDAVAAIAEVRGWNACRAAMLQGSQPVSQTYKLNELAGNSPVTPDGWISCSERMPDTKTAVLVAVEFDRKGDWRMKWATYIPGHPDANDGWVIPGASWKPSHWMPLPEPPEVNR
ncbi:DUF551 domain-containing protein [Escherichia albertii]|nr:DUF551 domain-containing protein [Escherichia albertii]EHX1088440.1 DUF551 domain-containing protein [Escherichia coli]EHK6582157.1 DUF551 domain-containing protein [Escherichia albertii]EHW5859327.1 DUF551 domain-containing protein [Escherichia albertii]MCU7302160.1 DUF551 domain-containing protein [Escherichia albertii]MCZ9027315.1 DUF551 domain-containing protein [Escherichia albertii]